MSTDWTTQDDRHARSHGFTLYVTDAFVGGRLQLRYSFAAGGAEKAKAAAERGDEIAKKALAIMMKQRVL